MNSMTSKPLITTIIPTYRRPKLLQRAIYSVLNQTYSHFQICVYDNASEDETPDVVGEFMKQDARIKYYCHPQNIGAINNFNYGMKKVITPFFSLLSDDNVLLPHFFEEAINTLNRYPEAVLFAGTTITVDENGRIIGSSLDRWQLGLVYPPATLFQILEKEIPIFEGVLFRKSVTQNVGLFNPIFTAAADQDFMMRIAKNYIFYISKKPCAVFHRHNMSWSAYRTLRDVDYTFRRRLEPWLLDEELSQAVKMRIRKAFKVNREHAIRIFVYHKSIVCDDKATLATAIELMKKEDSLSSKTLRIITVAKLVNSNRFLQKLVSIFIRWVRQFKLNLLLLKHIKAKRYNKYISVLKCNEF